MSKKIEATGKTIEEAIENGLNMLGGIDRDLVSVEVLEKPKPGFLGLGGTSARVSISFQEDVVSKATGFLEELLNKMGAEAGIKAEQKSDETIVIELSGDNMGILIGRRGETLDAIQHIVNLVINRGEEKHIRVSIDTENYRKKREESLEKLAQKVASQVQKYKRNKVLEPMNAYERHVIHAALQDYKDVSTSSTGNEPNRRVVVSYTGAGGARTHSYRSR